MKTFLFLLTSLRDGNKDNATVVGGSHYYHEQLLAVIDAEGAEQAASGLGVTIVDSLDRTSVNCPTIYYVGNSQRSAGSEEGSFYLSLREMEPDDEESHKKCLKEKIRLKVTVKASA